MPPLEPANTAVDLAQAMERLRAGETDALAKFFELSYDELRKLARSRLWAANLKGGFATESLLHESYLRLVNQRTVAIPDRQSFFAYASKVMRSVILDCVREANAQRRGGGEANVTLSTDLVEVTPDGADVEAINDALKDLQRISPDLAALVEMRFFGGMTEIEIAQTLGVSERTVRREWEKARSALVVLLES